MQEHSGTWDNCLEYVDITDVGLRRANNQDSLACRLASDREELQRRGHLFMVADGMGAHAAGEKASKMAVDAVQHAYYKLPEESPEAAVVKAIEDANRQIHNWGQANLDFRGMGTTASVLVLLPERALVAHVGDSRVYRLRGNQLDQLTFDHSLVWELKAARQIPDNEVPNYIPKNIITRSLGPSEAVEVDVEGPFPLLPGDTFLICSDGLTGQVADDEIGMILKHLPLAEAARVLVDIALLRGGPDNISIVLVRVKGGQLASGAPEGSSVMRVVRGPRRPIPVSIWVLLGLALLGTLLLGLGSQWTYALLPLGAFVVILIAALVFRRGPAPAGGPAGGLHGRAPHRSYVCKLDSAYVEKLSSLVQQLDEAAHNGRPDGTPYTIDWTAYHRHRDAGLQAFARKDLSTATVELCRALSCLMQQLRSQSAHDVIAPAPPVADSEGH
jgi:serine/threonine protein phosphatase PrpC